MKKYFTTLLILIAASFITPFHAKKPVVQKLLNQKVYLVCNALTTSYTYSALQGEISGLRRSEFLFNGSIRQNHDRPRRLRFTCLRDPAYRTRQAYHGL